MSRAQLLEKKKLRIRSAAKKKRGHRHVRLSIFRSNQHIYAQLIDDTAGTTLAAASTVDKELRKATKNGSNVAAAQAVGALIAKRAKELKVSAAVWFDRGQYQYHGRVKALADAAREGGLSF